jgi:hypothetical protein
VATGLAEKRHAKKGDATRVFGRSRRPPLHQPEAVSIVRDHALDRCP